MNTYTPTNPEEGNKMEYPIYEINGVKTYRTPRHLRKRRDITCWTCLKPVSVQTFICEHCGYEFPDFIKNK